MTRDDMTCMFNMSYNSNVYQATFYILRHLLREFNVLVILHTVLCISVH